MNPASDDPYEALTFHQLSPEELDKLKAKMEELDFDSDEPLDCPLRDQSGDTTCESCQ